MSNEENLKSPVQTQRLEDIFGYFPQVSSIPTWNPNTFRDQFAVYVSGGTKRLYVWDTANATWRYATLT